MVEYASMRFKLVCAMAAMLPIAIDSIAISTSIGCQSETRPPKPSTKSRITNANAAIFGAEP